MAANVPSVSSSTGFLNASAGPPPRLIKKEEANVVRNCVEFPTSKWTDHFVNCSKNIVTDGIGPNPLSSEQWILIEQLKGEVGRQLDALDNRPVELIKMIDAVQRLGLGYLFEAKTEQELKSLFHKYQEFEGLDLYHTSLLFRLLRQHGFNVPSNIFIKFLDKDGGLKQDIIKSGDVLGMVSFYEAAQLQVHADSPLLETALAKTIHQLESMRENMSPCLKELVTNSLKQPIHKDIPWLKARKLIDTYQEDETRDQILLRLAKHHFNFLQRCHQQELSSIATWWRDNADVGTKLAYARDRLVESYIWSLCIYYEPRYSLARKIYTIAIAFFTTLDDTYDAYGTADELELITETISRWDTSLFDQMPPYARSLCRILFYFYDTIEEDLARERKPAYCLPYLKEAAKTLAKSYYNEFLWLKKKQISTMDEYRKLAFASSGATTVIIFSLAGMGDQVPKAAYEWIAGDPKMVVASQVVCRFQDDIVSHERAYPSSAVECYMNEHGVSKAEACEGLQKEISDAWKDINEGCLRPTIFPFSVMSQILNFTRLIHVLYKDGDSMTHPVEFLEDKIVSLMVDPIGI